MLRHIINYCFLLDLGESINQEILLVLFPSKDIFSVLTFFSQGFIVVSKTIFLVIGVIKTIALDNSPLSFQDCCWHVAFVRHLLIIQTHSKQTYSSLSFYSALFLIELFSFHNCFEYSNNLYSIDDFRFVPYYE